MVVVLFIQRANFVTDNFKIGNLVKELFYDDIKVRLGIVIDSDMSNGMDDYIEIYWFSDFISSSREFIPYCEFTNIRNLRIISK